MEAEKVSLSEAERKEFKRSVNAVLDVLNKSGSDHVLLGERVIRTITASLTSSLILDNPTVSASALRAGFHAVVDAGITDGMPIDEAVHTQLINMVTNPDTTVADLIDKLRDLDADKKEK
mgnify:CR=1 FL=1|tara:strand:- start:4505 stop:4864 length:360 start_codon:yes stop_codon:yes gene_type:complete